MSSLMFYFYAWLYDFQVPFARTDPESVSDSLTMLKHLAILMFAEDFGFYWSHKLLHVTEPLPLYQWFHKQHHEYTHTVSLTATYAHPVEYTVANHITTFMGVLVIDQ